MQKRDGVYIGRKMLEMELSDRKAKDEIYGCATGAHEVSWCERRGC